MTLLYQPPLAFMNLFYKDLSFFFFLEGSSTLASVETTENNNNTKKRNKGNREDLLFLEIK